MGRIAKIICMLNIYHTTFFIVKENEVIIDLIGFKNRQNGDIIIDRGKYLEYLHKGFYPTRPVVGYVIEGGSKKLRLDTILPFNF